MIPESKRTSHSAGFPFNLNIENKKSAKIQYFSLSFFIQTLHYFSLFVCLRFFFFQIAQQTPGENVAFAIFFLIVSSP